MLEQSSEMFTGLLDIQEANDFRNILIKNATTKEAMNVINISRYTFIFQVYKDIIYFIRNKNLPYVIILIFSGNFHYAAAFRDISKQQIIYLLPLHGTKKILEKEIVLYCKNTFGDPYKDLWLYFDSFLLTYEVSLGENPFEPQ